MKATDNLSGFETATQAAMQKHLAASEAYIQALKDCLDAGVHPIPLGIKNQRLASYATAIINGRA